jgi:hypothetical protein
MKKVPIKFSLMNEMIEKLRKNKATTTVSAKININKSRLNE